MRHIGNLPNEEQAQRFSDYLLTLGINGMFEPDEDRWAVWVYDEDQVESARTEIDAFRNDPQGAEYQQAPEQAEKRREKERRDLAQHRKNSVDVRERWQRPMFAQTPVTAGLILLSLLAAATTSRFDSLWTLCDEPERNVYLYFTSYTPKRVEGGRIGKDFHPVADVYARGEVYRVVTPIFLHFSILHLLMNMMWMRSLASSVEMRLGKWRYLLMVLVIAATSNVAQFLFRGPNFGGMSGVVFGLFGYVWMKSRYDPESGFYLAPQTVFLMMAWMVFCYFGPLSIANAAHTVGLLVGMALGLWSPLRRGRLTGR